MKCGFRTFLAATIALSSLLVISELNAVAYEVDNFTERSVPRKDALAVMDHEINWILNKAASETNKESKNYCSFAHLRQEIIRWIHPDPAGILEIWANHTSQIEKTSGSIKKSVYANVTFSDSPALWFVGIGTSMRIGDFMIGTDKIGHFFMQGLDYYDRVNAGKDLDLVLQQDHGEDGAWGMTGVTSYADMSANYAGYLFWNSLVRGSDPYFKCVVGKGWVKQKEFTWKTYVSAAWDEAINCSDFTPAVQAKFDQRLQELHMTCPVEPVRCAELVKQDKARFMIGPKCQRAAQLLSQRN